ncbi:hypothetical protein C8R43DRAFT_1050661 [Mycena crocata]|nr:hypothetical protein C8R43DRAFT_1050661 [Mycena crocata]
MAHITAIVIEVTGGSPLFHIPVPLSAIPGLSGGTARRGGDGNTQAGSSNDAPDEKFQLVFRIKDGSPTFHIGGAEVGVSAADAYNYATALRGVVKARSKAKETRDRAAGLAAFGSRDIRVDETPRVRVKVEEETPRIPQRDKGKKREREKKQVEPAHAVGHAVMDVRAIAVPTASSVSPPSPTTFRRENREYTEEEQAAFARGSLTLENFAEVYAEGQHDFAVECAPSEPGGRKLSDIEDTEWRELWESLLHLDRIFSGPLRDNDRLKLRSDKMMAAAARRVHERESSAFKSGRGTSPSSNPQNKPPEVRPDSRQNGVQNQHAQNGAGTRGNARQHSQTGGNAPPGGRGYVQARNAGRVNAPALPDTQSSLGDIEVGESPTLNVTRNRNAKNGTAGNAPVASTSRNVAGESNAAMNPDRSVSGNSHANPTMNANQSHLHPQLDANEMNTSAIVANARLALRPLHQAMLAHGRAGSSSQESASNPASLGNTEWVLPTVGSRGSARGGLISLSQEVKENELRGGDSASGAAVTASTSATAAGTRTASLKRAREDEHEHDTARYRERDSRNGEGDREGVRNANREGEVEQDGTGAAKRPKRNKPVQQLQALGPSTPSTTRARAAKGKAAGDLAGASLNCGRSGVCVGANERGPSRSFSWSRGPPRYLIG